jgi:hypothetical protein
VIGRQLARTSVVRYRETLWSDVFPGNYHTVQCLEPAVLATENALDLSTKRRKRTVWRLDGGAGSEQHMRWLLRRGYHLLAKGLNNRRAHAMARQVQRWDAYRDMWLGEVPEPTGYPRPVRIFVLRREDKGKTIHNYYVTTLKLSSKCRYLSFYNARGGAEVEQFRSDKQGLSLAARRKRRFPTQVGFVLLADLAHNLLAHFCRHALAGSRFESFGLKRSVRDLLAFPGRLVFDGAELKRVELLSRKHFASDLIICLEKYCSGE